MKKSLVLITLFFSVLAYAHKAEAGSPWDPRPPREEQSHTNDTGNEPSPQQAQAEE
ncbi:MAG: hypothetical protein K0R52_52 [Alphaproteobacteria bacterium]|jgi:hypothetical protein|nr:hypothetical protein [Alphaproteobacteria bacterium]